MIFLWLAVVSIGMALYCGILAFGQKGPRAADRLGMFVEGIGPEKGHCSNELGFALGVPLKLGRTLEIPMRRLRMYGPLEKWNASGKIDSLLKCADMDDLITAEDFVRIRLGSAILLAFVALPGSASFGSLGPALLIAAAVVGFKLPAILLAAMANARKTEVKKALLDAIDLLAVGVGAGMSIDRAMRIYAERFDNALAEEFRRAFARLDVGKSRREAFSELSERTDVEGLKVLVSSILQAEKLGTPLSMILADLSRDIKERHRQSIREASAKVPVKMLFPLAGLILPALFIVLLGPVALQLFRGP